MDNLAMGITVVSIAITGAIIILAVMLTNSGPSGSHLPQKLYKIAFRRLGIIKTSYMIVSATNAVHALRELYKKFNGDIAEIYSIEEYEIGHR